MSDRTTVNLCVPTIIYADVLALIGDDLIGDESCHDGDGITEITYRQVNGGILGFEEKLKSNNVPFSCAWGAGYEYGAGSMDLRVDGNGNVFFNKHDDCDYNKVCLDELKIAAKKGIDGVKELIKKVDSTMNIMSWADQIQILSEHKEKLFPATLKQ